MFEKVKIRHHRKTSNIKSFKNSELYIEGGVVQYHPQKAIRKDELSWKRAYIYIYVYMRWPHSYMKYKEAKDIGNEETLTLCQQMSFAKVKEMGQQEQTEI